MKNIDIPPPPPPPPIRSFKHYPFIGDIETKESKQRRLDWEKETIEWRNQLNEFSKRIKEA